MDSVIQFVVSHEVIVAGAVVGILDLVIALNPKAESNGVLHGIYIFCKNIVSKKALPAA
jgi:hypothetical protein